MRKNEVKKKRENKKYFINIKNILLILKIKSKQNVISHSKIYTREIL